MSTISFYEYHNIYGFWGKKNFKSSIFFPQSNKEILVEHNSFGVRDNEFNLKKRHKRNLCIGGSHTWGAAIDVNKRYSNLLNDSYLDQEFINFGHCSLGIDQIYFFLRNEIKKFNPDQVIIEQYPWALLRTINNYVNGYIRPHFLLSQNGEVYEKKINYISKIKLFRKLFGGYLKFNKEFNEYQNNISSESHDYVDYIDPIFKAWNQPFYKEMYYISEYIFKKIKVLCDDLKVQLLVIVNMSKEEYFNSDNNNELINYKIPRLKTIDIMQKLKIDFLDLELEFNKNSQSPFFEDGHINDYGNHLIAENIKRYIC